MIRATIISDASFCLRTGAAGWAAWAKSDISTSSRMWSGALKSNPETSLEAELFALANALHAAIEAGIVDHGSEITLQSDATGALGLILARVPGATLSAHPDSATISLPKRKGSENVHKALAAISRMVADNALALKCRHVRGHKLGAGRQWVNRKCDSAARAAMRTSRAALAKGAS